MQIHKHKNERTQRARKGQLGENIAALLLLCKGYRILYRRLRSPLGEVDLLAQKGKILVVVEVKWRRDLVTAAYAITRRQQQRLQRAGEALFQQHAIWLNIDSLRFDAIIIAPFAIEHIKNAF